MEEGRGKSLRGSEVSDKKIGTLKELTELYERIDRIALFAFDIYMRCREKIHEIQTKGIKTILH